MMKIGRIAFLTLWALGSGFFEAQCAQEPIAVHKSDGTSVTTWLVLGPFPSGDFCIDFLSRAGGESGIRPKEEDRIASEESETLVWKKHISRNEAVSLRAIFGATEEVSVAYAYCELESDAPGEALFQLLKRGDTAAWVNGKAVEFTRSNETSSDWSSALVSLQPGRNPCLVKVSSSHPLWEFAVRVLPADRAIVDGKLTGPSGPNAAGALVELYRGGEAILKTRADAAGKYRFDVMPFSGAAGIKASLNTWAAWDPGLTLTRGGRIHLDLRLEEAGSISGAALAMDRKTPQTSVPVQAFKIGDNSVEEFVETVLTDEKGEYQFIGLKPGRYRVRCQTPSGFLYYRRPGDSNAVAGSDLVIGQAPLRRIDFIAPQMKKGFWRSFSTYDGLSHQSIGCVQVVEKGPLYLGLQSGGINEFDGAEFKDLREVRIAGGYVHGMDRDLDGYLWIAAGSDGVIQYRGNEMHAFTSTNGLVHNSAQRVRVDHDRNVWMGTRFGLSKYAAHQDRFETFRTTNGLSSDWILSIFEEQNGPLWVGTLAGACRFNGWNFEPVDLPLKLEDRSVFCIFQSRDGALWFGTADGVVRRQRNQSRKLTVRDGMLGGPVISILETADGHLWFATDRGLSRYDGTLFVNYTTLDGLVHNRISQLHNGPDGTLWVATNDGLSLFDPNAFVQWSHKDGLMTADGRAPGINCIKAMPGDEIWIGTDSGIFVCKDERVTQPQAFADIGGAADIHRAVDGTIWVGNAQGLWRYEAGAFKKEVSREVYRLTSDTRGNIWFGVPGGSLWRYHSATRQLRALTSAEGVPDTRIWGMRGASDGAVWLGSYAGLYLFDGEQFVDVDDRRKKTDSEGHAVWAIHVDAQGSLWFGGSGVFARWMSSSGAPLFFEAQMGVSQPKIWDISEAGGVLWLATGNHGLIGFDRAVFTALDTRDGLGGKIAKGVAIDSKGQIWVGTRDGGLTRYRRGQQRPDVQLVSVNIDDRLSSDLIGRIGVQARHRVTINCRGIDFKTAPPKRQFLYSCRTADGMVLTNSVTRESHFDWIPPKAGMYRFEVSAIDRDLNYSSPAVLSFAVTPPWYVDPWKAGPAGAGILGLVLLSSMTGWRYMAHRREAERLQRRMLHQERHARESLEESNQRLEEAKEAAEHARVAAEEAKEAAELASRAKSIFLANMSHEIRTPLNAILGYAQILQRNGNLDPNQRQAITTIERSGHHLLALINEILDLSKIESGRMELSMGDFDLCELISAMSVMFKPRCQQKGLKWEIEGLGDGPRPVHGDEGKLRQVLINLVANAVKFTDRGAVALCLDAREDNIYSFQVIDTGPGIPEDTQKKILEPFTQGAEGKHKGGTGLGLAISRRQVELMGGELRLESEVGQGSRFYFSLHLPPARNQLVRKSIQPERRVRRLREGFKIKALVVDDIADNRHVLEHFLKDLGLEVTVVETGEQAWTELQARQFDVAFIDIQMPGLNGVELAERVVKKWTRRAVKLVAISASVLKHEQAEYAAKGFDAFVPKPFRFEQICECLAELVGAHFEYEKEIEPGAPAAPQPKTRLELPPELFERLRVAAEAYSVTDFEMYLQEVEALGNPGKELAAQLRELSRNVRIEEILSVLSDVRPES